MHHVARKLITVLALMLSVSSPWAGAQNSFRLPPAPPIPTPEIREAIRLYPGVAPGSERAAQREIWEQGPLGREVRNVTTPVLIPVLPPTGKASGTAAIVAPGGGFSGLAIDGEGYDVARWLAANGISAFILKYRVRETPADRDEFARQLSALLASGKPIAPLQLALDDGRRAVRMLRGDAARLGLRADRIGMLGFSAGAATTLEVTLSEQISDRPDFIGMLYGRQAARPVPGDAPPAFIALAVDDPLYPKGEFGLASAWATAGRPVELHLYGQGGHGFGMGKKGLTSDLWPDQFLAWLRMNDLWGRQRPQ